MTKDTKTRDANGRFAALVCVNAHDRCFYGGPCLLCEIKSSTPKTKEKQP